MTWAKLAALALGLALFSTQAWAFTFAVFGDNRDGEETFKLILNKLNADPPAFAVNTGDFVSRGSKAEYEHYIKLIKGAKFKVYNVMGNHDEVYGGGKWFAKYFGPDHYSFDYENSHFIVLNNAFKGDFDKKQYDWLVADLKKNYGKNIFVFFHKPIFDPSETYPNYVMSERKTGQELMELFKRYKVRYVFTGHIHGYARAEREGVVYIVTAGAGAPLYLPRWMGGFNHYVKITVDGDRINEEVVKIYD
ncbi:MAG: metallophosphoesterase [Candidatus Margulisiibacteriota bacterium]